MTRLFLAALALAFASCDFEQVVELDAPDYTPRLVVGAFPAADSVFVVSVGESVSAFEPGGYFFGDLAVTDAAVRLLGENGDVLDVLDYVPVSSDFGEQRAYRARNGTRAQAGQAYTLEASAPGFPSARASTRLPDPVPFTVRYEGTTETDPDYGARRARLVVAFEDPPGDQTYALSVLGTYRDGNGVLRSFRNSFTSTDPVLRRGYGEVDAAVDFDIEADGARYFERAYFRDRLVSEQAYEVALEAFLWTYSPDPDDRLDAFTVRLSVLGEDYVTYQQTLELQRQNDGNPFAEPVRVHSNVDGGLGVFSGTASSQVQVSIAGAAD